MSLNASREIQIRTKAVLLFAITFAVYFVSRSPALDEIDSVNFAMGLRHFDLWNSQTSRRFVPVLRRPLFNLLEQSS
jgi:hypothetical protein